MKTRYLYLLRIILACSDLILVNVSFFLGFYLSNKYFISFDKDIYQHNVIASNLIWIISTGIFALYSDNTIHQLDAIFKATWKSIFLYAFLFIAYLFFNNQTDFPKHFLIVFYSLFTGGIILSRYTGKAFQTQLVKNFDIRKSVAILGMNNGALKLALYLDQQSSLNFVGFLGGDPELVEEENYLKLDLVAEKLRAAAESGIEEVYVSIHPDRMNDVLFLIKEGEKQCVRLKFVPDLTAFETNFKLDTIGNFTMLLCADKEPVENVEFSLQKSLANIAAKSSVMKQVSRLNPFKIQNQTPVLVSQLKSSRNRLSFWRFKLNNIHANNANVNLQASVSHRQITENGFHN